METKNIYYVLSVMLGGITAALGGFDMALRTLMCFMALDYISGIAIALVWKKSPKSKSGTVESRESIKGLFRKGGVLLVVYLAVQLDRISGNDFIRSTVILFFIGNEGISLIENLGIVGVPLPSVIVESFDVLKNKKETNTK